MKNYVNHAVSIYEGIISDAATRWPDLRCSFEKDLSYLRRAVEARGIAFFAVTLPSVGKVLDRGLDDGCLVISDFPQGMTLIKDRPKLFGCLFSLIFDDRNMLRPDPDIDAVCFLRQFLYCCKKLRLPCKPTKVMETIDEFFSIEEDLPPNREDTWDSDAPRWSTRRGHPIWGDFEKYTEPCLPGMALPPSCSLPWDTLSAICRRVVSRLGTPDWWEMRPKHGPGAVSEAKWEGLKYEFPYWPSKLEYLFPYDWHGSGLLIGSVPSDREPPSRLHAVPKSFKGPRLICAEPIAHQWMQQGILRWLEENLKKTHLGLSIDFRSQENSRKRALSASIDGMSATIDLSSASDRISTRLVEYIFQGSDILDGLHACRTRVLEQNLSQTQPRLSLLRKFSTMGSAVTFPIQSIVFTLLAVWAVRLADNKWAITSEEDLASSFREVTVYGDDIILPVRALETIKLIFHECGLKVNLSKSYGGSHFRESCGCDAFMGYDVTPAYALQPYDDSPSLMATTVEVSNNFFRKGYWGAAAVVTSQIPPQEIKLLRVCGKDDGNFGLFSFVGTDLTHLSVRWDPDLQRNYSISISVTSRVKKQRGRYTADLTQYFTERPNPDIVWEAGQVVSTRLRKGRVRVYS